jgi:hypothetical protein
MIPLRHVSGVAVDGTAASAVGDVFTLGTLTMLSIALPLSVIAAYGFRNAPFGSMLKPLPVMIVAFILLNAINLLEIAVSGVGYLVLSTVAVGAALVATINGILLLTERRAV